jgi:hypothetical protein
MFCLHLCVLLTFTSYDWSIFFMQICFIDFVKQEVLRDMNDRYIPQLNIL